MRHQERLIRLLGVAIVWSAILTASLAAQQPSPPGPPGKTQVVLLGTGNPFPDPDRSGPATAIVVNGRAYLVDFGPGVVRRAKAAMFDKGIPALEPTNLTVAFATHLHSDHTVGYPDLIFTPWVMGRKVPLEVYGPKGIKAMTDHVLSAWQADIEERVSTETWQPPNYRDTYKVNVHEISSGVIYKDANVTVTAFPTKHAFAETYGYRFDTADRSIVISGDTTYSQATIDACHGCDVLIHEANTLEWLAKGVKSLLGGTSTSTKKIPRSKHGRDANRSDSGEPQLQDIPIESKKGTFLKSFDTLQLFPYFLLYLTLYKTICGVRELAPAFLFRGCRFRPRKAQNNQNRVH